MSGDEGGARKQMMEVVKGRLAKLGIHLGST